MTGADKLVAKKRVAALEAEVKKVTAARMESEKQATELQAANTELSERLAILEAAEDPLPSAFDEIEAASSVDRLLGISKVEMSDNVKELLWTQALRRVGVLTAKEYELRKKRLLARDLDYPVLPTGGPGDADKKSETQGSPNPPQTGQTREDPDQ